MQIDKNKLNAAIETAKSKTADKRWITAIDKAASKLASGAMIVTLLKDHALVTSDGGTYKVNGHCDCPARVSHCYHRAGKRLVEMMESTVSYPNEGILVRPEGPSLNIGGWDV